MRSRRMGLRESTTGSSVASVWESSRGTVALLIGDAANACAALAGSKLSGYDVCHVICVGNGNTARKLEERRKGASRASAAQASPGVRPIERRRSATSRDSSPPSPGDRSPPATDLDVYDIPPQHRAEREVSTVTLPPSEVSAVTLATAYGKNAEADEVALEGGDDAMRGYDSEEAAAAAAKRSLDVKFQAYRIADTLQPDADVDIGTELADHLAGIQQAIRDCKQADAALADTDRGVGPRLDDSPGVRDTCADIDAAAAAGRSDQGETIVQSVAPDNGRVVGASFAERAEDPSPLVGCGSGITDVASASQARSPRQPTRSESATGYPERNGSSSSSSCGVAEAARSASRADSALTTSAAGQAPVHRAVLVHCELGYNRSPTLVLAFLVQSGYYLREAYRRVLRCRPMVDPLPPFRRALENLERRLHSKTTIRPEDWFAKHISQLVEEVESKAEPRQNEVVSGSDADSDSSNEDPVVDLHVLEEAVRLRDSSIAALLKEVQCETASQAI